MFRIPSMAAFCLTLTLFCSLGGQQAQARWWSASATYNSAYFHDYYNYGARYSHRPYGFYHGYYGQRTFSGFPPTGYYGGWSTYAPYAYTPSVYTSSYYGAYPAIRYVGYGTATPGGCNSCHSVAVAPVAYEYAPTCCATNVAYGPGCFNCGSRRGLLGPLCPFRRARCDYGSCGSFGYSSVAHYGW